MYLGDCKPNINQPKKTYNRVFFSSVKFLIQVSKFF